MADFVADNGTSMDDVMEVLQNDEAYRHVVRKEKTFSQDVPCKICGSPAIGYSFYGVICCNACKAFFKRAIRARNLSCLGKEVCNNNCRKCRLDKCLQAGMKPEQIRQHNGMKMVPKVSLAFTLEDEIWLRGLWAGASAIAGQHMIDNEI